MNTYYWKSSHDKGSIQAKSIHHAKAILINHHIEWHTIRRSYRSFFPIRKHIRKREINLFLQQLTHLITAHLSILQAIKTIQSGNKNSYFQSLLQDIEKFIFEGNMLCDALNKHPAYFNTMICELIRLGELSGNLEYILKHITEENQKNLVLANKIKKAAFYPCIVIFITAIITFLLLNDVVPEFSDFYQGFSATLPKMTRLLIFISSFIQKSGTLCFSTLLLFYGLSHLLIKRTPVMRSFFSILIFKIPLMGNLIRKIILLRALRSLSLLIHSGMPILTAIELTSDICLHSIYTAFFKNVLQQIKQGQSIAESLDDPDYIPSLVIELIKTGEAAGQLNLMLDKAVFFYEQEVDQQLNQLQLLIEPILLIILSLVITFILLALYLPIFNIGNII